MDWPLAGEEQIGLVTVHVDLKWCWQLWKKMVLLYLALFLPAFEGISAKLPGKIPKSQERPQLHSDLELFWQLLKLFLAISDAVSSTWFQFPLRQSCFPLLSHLLHSHLPALVIPNMKDVAVPAARLGMENLPQDQGVLLRAGQAARLL